jgi:SSS family transporter
LPLHSPILAAFGPLDWSIVAAYFILVIVIGFLVSRHDTTESEFFLGNRSMPTWAVAISLVATMLSAVTFVGVPDIAYKGNLSYLVLNLGGIIAVFIVAFFFIPKLYAAGTVTIYGFLAHRFGEPARLAVSCAFILGRMLSSGARLFTAAIPLCLLLFGNASPPLWQILIAIALIGVIGTIYATAGGVRAVVWVDTLQFTLVMGAALLTIGILLHRLHMPAPDILAALSHPAATAPSKLALLDLSLNPASEFTLWTALIGNTFLMTAALGVDHDLAQRFLITKSAFRGGISVIASQFIGIVVVSLFLFIGLLLFLFYQRADPSVQRPQAGLATYPWFLLHELPTGLAGISIVGFFAIAQGSLDSAMNALAASIVSDVYTPLRQRRSLSVPQISNLKSPISNLQSPAPRPHAPKFAVAAVGIGLTLLAMLCALAFNPKSSILSYVLSLMGFAYSGMLAVFLTALFTRRGNANTVIAALLTGMLLSVILHISVMPLWTPLLFGTKIELAWPWSMPLATLAAFLVCITGKPAATALAKS